ncbi:hypothetical protein H6761_02840 [Candidatus Nomurabacteria bacterium]|nr:hypothetical protein [Candidatus Nomurabacteria bacterium]
MDFSQVDNQTKTEFRATRIFIRSQNLDDTEKNFKKEIDDLSIDIIYIPKSLKFQIVSVDGGPDKLMSKGEYEWSFLLTDFFRIYIKEPILKKTKKYAGQPGQDTILIIHALNMPATEEIITKTIEDNKNHINKLGNDSGFNKIFLIFDSKEKVFDLFK